MKKKMSLLILVVFSLMTICYAYPTYGVINLLPVVIQGDVNISLEGRRLAPERGGAVVASDVDVHQVVIYPTKTYGMNGAIDENLVQYVPTDEMRGGASGILDMFYDIDVALLPSSAGSEAFVLLRSADLQQWYRIYILQNVGVYVMYNHNGSIIKKLYKYNCQANRTYKVSVSYNSHTLKFSVSEYGLARSTMIASDNALDTVADEKLMHFFVGTSKGPAKFTNERLIIFPYSE